MTDLCGSGCRVGGERGWERVRASSPIYLGVRDLLSPQILSRRFEVGSLWRKSYLRAQRNDPTLDKVLSQDRQSGARLSRCTCCLGGEQHNERVQ